MRGIILVLALVLVIFTLTACDGPTETASVEYIVEVLETVDTDDADIEEAGQELFAVGDNPYAVILNAYIELWQSDFILYNAELIGHSIFVQAGGDPFGNRSNDDWQLMYALHDISGSGQPALFIAAKSREHPTPSADSFITGIYTLRNAESVSVIQLGNRRHSVRLFTDINDSYVITHGHGHMSHAWEYFYALDENGALTMLDRLYTGGHRVRHDEVGGYDYIYAFFRYRYVDGEEVSITEEEYAELIRKYGSWGYGLPTGTVEARYVSLEWRPVVSANQ